MPACFLPGLQVLCQTSRFVTECAKVNNSLYIGFTRFPREQVRHLEVSSMETLSTAHAVYQVIRDIDALERASDGIVHVQIRFDGLYLIGPRQIREAVNVPGNDSHVVTCFKQQWNEPTADIPGSPSNQNVFHSFTHDS